MTELTNKKDRRTHRQTQQNMTENTEGQKRQTERKK